MIKKLRRKFILITMAVITSVVFVIVAGINIAFSIKGRDESIQILNVIKENGGEMPKPNKEEPYESYESISPETMFQARYFTVVLDATRTTAVINTKNIYLIDELAALECTKSLLSQNKTDGLYNIYRYTTLKQNEKIMYIFLDCSNELSNSNNLLLVSSLIGIGAVGIIFVLIFLFSGIVVKPFAESYEKQKRFITDANHELKTPLTVISATNEIIEMKNGKNEWTDTINNQVQKLTGLTNELVFLSQMNENGESYNLIESDISDLILKEIEEFKPIADTSKKKFIINVPNGINAKVEPMLFERLMDILLDNAFKYSNPKGKIEVTLTNLGRHKVIFVKNTVTEIPKGDLSCLFERFYRLDSSRNSETGGSGIGLSIAYEIALIHKAKITAKSEDGKSIVFEIIL